MFGWNRRKRRKKSDGVADVGSGLADVGEAVGDGCGCDLPLVALTVIAGATLFVLAR